jgi:thiamine pyrophosphokinase
MSVLVFANGDVDEVDWIRPYLDQATAVIAANGGTRHLLRLEWSPAVLIGDLDSLPQEAQDWLRAQSVTVHQFPHEKDETDLELALLHAVSHYDGDIQVIGASGGRVDQTLANIMLLAHPALAGRRVELVSDHQRAWLVKDQTEVVGEIGDMVSLIPLGGNVLVQKTSGLRWPLENEILSIGPARGVSNVLAEPVARIVVGAGTLLCIHTGREWVR